LADGVSCDGAADEIGLLRGVECGDVLLQDIEGGIRAMRPHWRDGTPVVIEHIREIECAAQPHEAAKLDMARRGEERALDGIALDGVFLSQFGNEL
jgi:hypothetical protein